jgi:hypothetical protein
MHNNNVNKYRLNLVETLMKKWKIVCLISWLFLMLSFSIGAQQPQKSDWLNTVEGSRDYVLGAQVLNVVQKDNFTTVEVGFSENVLKHFHCAFAESRTPKKIIAYTTAKDLLKDQQNRPYGIRFKFIQPPGFEFRVKLYKKVELQQKP